MWRAVSCVVRLHFFPFASVGALFGICILSARVPLHFTFAYCSPFLWDKIMLLRWNAPSSRSSELAIQKARISAFAMREWIMRLPWYDSPTAQVGWCRAVTRLLSLSKHRGSRFVCGCYGRLVSTIMLKSVHISTKFRVMDTFCDL